MASLFDGIALEALVSNRIIGDHEWTIEDVAALCHQLQREVKGGRVWHHGALKIERELSESITLQHKATTST